MPRYNPPWPTDKRGDPFPQRHHLIPRSRGGDDHYRNIVEGIPSDLHWCWHRLFDNLTPMEILTVLVRNLMRPGAFHPYPKLTKEGVDQKPPEVTPDKVILALERQVFPRNWVPSKKLIRRLERLRKKRSRES
ncbi:MAG TPA: hypothetical protein VI794_00795 [Patescibacteria group bacterium]|nr:hypothetical protein [Patescibacteria group bacterium]